METLAKRDRRDGWVTWTKGTRSGIRLARSVLGPPKLGCTCLDSKRAYALLVGRETAWTLASTAWVWSWKWRRKKNKSSYETLLKNMFLVMYTTYLRRSQRNWALDASDNTNRRAVSIGVWFRRRSLFFGTVRAHVRRIFVLHDDWKSKWAIKEAELVGDWREASWWSYFCHMEGVWRCVWVCTGAKRTKYKNAF